MNAREVLGVGDEATYEEAHKAYREKASASHPDRGGDLGRFLEVTQAWRELSRELRRTEPCPACQGRGERVDQHGFHVTRRACKPCKGTGRRHVLPDEAGQG